MRNYSHLTDDEFLSVLDEKNGQSPIIDECIRRIENLSKEYKIAEDANTRVECPVCEASLEVEQDEHNKMFRLILND